MSPFPAITPQKKPHTITPKKHTLNEQLLQQEEEYKVPFSENLDHFKKYIAWAKRYSLRGGNL